MDPSRRCRRRQRRSPLPLALVIVSICSSRSQEGGGLSSPSALKRQSPEPTASIFRGNSTLAANDVSDTRASYDDEQLDVLLDQLQDSMLVDDDVGRSRSRNYYARHTNARRERRRRREQRRQLDDALLTNLTVTSARPIRSWNLLTRTFRRHSSHLLDAALDKFLSAESAGAISSIRTILCNLEEDHGVVDVLSLYSPREVLLSGLALSRLQSAAIVAEERGCVSGTATRKTSGRRIGRLFGFGRDRGRVDSQAGTNSTSPAAIDPDLLEMIAHYAKFAVSAYGWKGRLALSGRLHWGDVRALEARTGIHRSDIIDANWRSRTHRPAYFIVRDKQRKKIILSVRGTWSPRDLLTDLCATVEDYEICKNKGLVSEPSSFLQRRRRRNNGKKRSKGKGASPRAHQGMVESAREIARVTTDTIKNELEWNPDYSLVIGGHSLGGGISAVLGSMWKDTFPGLTVLAYGCPCTGPLDTEPTNNKAIISIVAENDPFSCLSIGHLADVSTAVSRLCDNTDMRDDILRRSRLLTSRMIDSDLRWCHDVLQWLRKECMTSDAKLYPPGRILYMRGSSLFRGNGKGITLEEVSASAFRELVLHARMFDLSRHIATRYESALERVWRQTKE